MTIDFCSVNPDGEGVLSRDHEENSFTLKEIRLATELKRRIQSVLHDRRCGLKVGSLLAAQTITHQIRLDGAPLKGRVDEIDNQIIEHDWV